MPPSLGTPPSRSHLSPWKNCRRAPIILCTPFRQSRSWSVARSRPSNCSATAEPSQKEARRRLTNFQKRRRLTSSPYCGHPGRAAAAAEPSHLAPPSHLLCPGRTAAAIGTSHFAPSSPNRQAVVSPPPSSLLRAAPPLYSSRGSGREGWSWRPHCCVCRQEAREAGGHGERPHCSSVELCCRPPHLQAPPRARPSAAISFYVQAPPGYHFLLPTASSPLISSATCCSMHWQL